ncbi:hypothetical protein LRAMOSA08521 [Lichtheimia ramosa]|uniref:DUF7905 domain-containing protein n=1 Tax=Lichtheimia ramosa TaxID=688394 RepID=A0A077WG13_9FUNG|nr:hypothetical protein LRAMOSA08521 [Lichtheimia ramosa]
MSIIPDIAPDVPYADDSEEEEEESWRDPTILPDRHALRLAQGRELDRVDFDMKHTESPDQMPVDCWMLPPEYTLTDVLGEKRFKLEEIRRDTSTSLKYNESKHQVDIWGEKSCVQRAKQHLDLIVARLNERAEANRRRTKKWGKPERELTPREKRRVDRLAARQAEEKSYQGYPDAPQPYNAIVPLPSDDVPLTKLLGTRDAFLNQMRAECKCWMYVDKNRDNTVRIAGQEEDRVIMAATRMRNWYLRNVRQPYQAMLHLMKQPRNYMLVKYRKLPQGFITYKYATGSEQQTMLSEHRLLESINIGRYDESRIDSSTAEESTNLIDLDDPVTTDTTTSTKKENTSSNLPESLQHMDDDNANRIRHALEYGLESIRLFDWEIRMKIRFGQVCLINYRRIEDTIQLDKLALKTFNNPKFHMALAPCIGRTKDDMRGLFEYMNQHATEFNGSPQTSYVIQARQYPTFTTKHSPSNHRSRREVSAPPPNDENLYHTTTICQFTSERRVGLWNTLTDCHDRITVNCADLESEYSWDLKLQTARRLGSDNMDSPHGKFVDSLRLNEATGRLCLLAKSDDYTPKLVTQKTKWLYEFEEKWIIEIIRDEIWDLEEMEIPEKRQELPIDLSEQEPHRVLFKVSARREEWTDRFADNLGLSVGQAPYWLPRDFLATETEDTKKIMQMAQKITAILSSEVPQYWNTLM